MQEVYEITCKDIKPGLIFRDTLDEAKKLVKEILDEYNLYNKDQVTLDDYKITKVIKKK